RARRIAEHARRAEAAEAAYLAAVTRLGEVEQSVTSLRDELRRRDAVTRARTRRIYEHAWRRVATYWQQLVRTHEHGRELNARLRPVGPELPEWAREPVPSEPTGRPT